MNIARHIFHYCLKREPQRIVAFPQYNRCRQILLIFESDPLEENEQIYQIINQLKADGKDVTAWGYTNKKVITTPSSDIFRIFGKKDTTLFGRPNKETIHLLQSRSYDLLIDLSLSNTLTTAWLTLLADTAFRTGKATDETPYLHNLMIQTDNTADQQSLFKHILFYLQHIKTQD